MKRIDLIKYLVPIVLAAILLVTCRNNKQSPGLVYMPDMDLSLAYEYLKVTKDSEKGFTDWVSTLKPVEGTIPMGHEKYHLENTPEGYNEAALRTDNPIEKTEEVMLRGQEIYTIHCEPCHGPDGDSNGPIATGGYVVPPPSANFKTPMEPGYLSAGRIFHVVTYGRNLMGSYSSQVSVEDRWKVVHYVQSLSGEGTADETAEPADSTAAQNTEMTAAAENTETTNE